ncbi:hypothetical protein (partial), partial [Candidatus Ichthyocystis hellenicum]
TEYSIITFIINRHLSKIERRSQTSTSLSCTLDYLCHCETVLLGGKNIKIEIVLRKKNFNIIVIQSYINT